MKTKEELIALKGEIEAVSKKLSELTEDELKEVLGGIASINEDGIFWLKEESIDSNTTDTWYGIDNDVHFEPGSRFWVRWSSPKIEE